MGLLDKLGLKKSKKRRAKEKEPEPPKDEMATQWMPREPQWRGLQTRLRTIQLSAPTLDQLVSTGSFGPSYADLRAATDEIPKLLAKGKVKDALGKLDQTLKQIDTAEKLLEAHQGISAERVSNEALGKIATTRTADKAQFEQLAGKMKEVNDQAPSDYCCDLELDYDRAYGRCRNQIMELRDGGPITFDSKKAADAFRAALKPSVQTFVNERGEIMKKLGALLKNSSGIKAETEKALAADATKAMKPQFELIADGVERDLKNLENWGADSAKGLRKTYDALCQRAYSTNDFSAAILDLGPLQSNIDKATAEHVDAYAKRIQPVMAKMAELEKAYNKVSAGQESKKALTGHWDLLNDTVAMARNLVHTGKNPDAVESAIPLIDKAASVIDDITKSEKSLGLYVALKGEIEKALKDKTVVKTKPEETGKLTEAYEKLVAAAESSPPSTTLSMLKSFSPKVLDKEKGVKPRALRQAEWQSKTTATFKQVDKELKSLDSIIKGYTNNTDHPVSKYRGALWDEFESAKSVYKDEPDFTISRVDAMIDRIRKGVSQFKGDAEHGGGDRAALLRDHETEEENRNRAAERLAEFERDYAEFEKFRSLVHKKTKDEDEYQSIKKQGESTKDMAVKSGDVDAAQYTLTRAWDRIRYLNEHPEGSRLASRKELAGLGKQWSGAVDDMRARLKQLAAVAKESAEEDPSFSKADGLKDLQPTLVGVADFLKSDVFQSAIGPLTAEDSSDGDRKRARETALKYVRLYQDYTSKNTMVAHAVKNPFKVDAVAKRVYDTLRSLDLNAQRCI